MNKFIIIVCCFSLMSLMPIPEIDTSEQVLKIALNYTAKVKEKGFSSCGNGASLRGGVKRIELFLETFEELVDIAKARRIYVDIAEGFIAEINQDKLIRPYLHDYPCGNRNIGLLIGFNEKNQDQHSEDYIALTYVVNGFLYYLAYDHIKDTFVNLYKEPYEEALRIVQEEAKQQTSSID